MWEIIGIAQLVVELCLLAGFVIGRLRKKKLNEKFLFLGAVFVNSFALQLIPYLYSRIALSEPGNYVLDVLGCLMQAVKLFVGDVEVSGAKGFAGYVTVFTYTYLFGVALALLATISTALEVFNHTIRNHFRLVKALKKESCDLVLGTSEKALYYAKNGVAVLVVGEKLEKSKAVSLMEDGYIVLRKGFSQQLLKSNRFNRETEYHIICPDESQKQLEYINQFIAAKQSEKENKKFRLYVEGAEARMSVIHREIMEKSALKDQITTFSTEELLARTFVEENPIARYLSNSFVEKDTSLKSGTQINVIFLGFGNLNREICRQSILNNQYVIYENGEYRGIQVKYHIYDPNVNAGVAELESIEQILKQLEKEKEQYFTLPDMPFALGEKGTDPCSRRTLAAVEKLIRKKNSFSYVIVDTGDDYCNMETGVRLGVLLDGEQDVHLFIRSEVPYTENTEMVTYFGKVRDIFTREVIVNESLCKMAKKLNEVYEGQRMKAKGDIDTALVSAKAKEKWEGFDYFTRYSNIYAAMNLRVKLNLLGLDYVKDGKRSNTGLIGEAYPRRKEGYEYREYFDRSKRNALLAQEHARWNAYHLMAEYLPLRKEAISVDEIEGTKVSFVKKKLSAKRHACLTTFNGLNEVFEYLAERAMELTGTEHSASEYDAYCYDEDLILSAEELLVELGHSVVKK